MSGYIYKGTDENQNAVLEINKEKSTYKILQFIEFNSTRKRMSIILSNPADEIFIYTKGADSIMFERINPNEYMLYYFLR